MGDATIVALFIIAAASLIIVRIDSTALMMTGLLGILYAYIEYIGAPHATTEF